MQHIEGFEPGDRVKLKKDRTGIIWHPDLTYTVHVAKAGELGTVTTGLFEVLTDSGIKIGYSANDLIDPYEEFNQTYEKITLRVKNSSTKI